MHEPEDSPHVQAVVATQATFLQLLIKEYDANKDGKVSRDEFITAVEKVLCSGSVPDWWKLSIDKAFESGDYNHKGYISFEELLHSIQLINPKESEENIKQAFEWATKESGKYDKDAHFKVSYTWATSPDPAPEASVLTPYFRRIA
jgi:Ca2+-binding EF-hand superfamily protein